MPIVAQKLGELRDCTRRVQTQLKIHLSKERGISIIKAHGMQWSNVSSDTQDKFANLLEEKALDECGLEIARCEDMWAARSLLSSVKVSKSRLEMVCV